MAEYNHTCIICGKKYDHCDKCRQVNSWKAICCSIECYQKYIKPVVEEIEDFMDKPKEKVEIKEQNEKQVKNKYLKNRNK